MYVNVFTFRQRLVAVIFDIRWIDAINNQFYRAYGGYMLVGGYRRTSTRLNSKDKILKIMRNGCLFGFLLILLLTVAVEECIDKIKPKTNKDSLREKLTELSRDCTGAEFEIWDFNTVVTSNVYEFEPNSNDILRGLITINLEHGEGIRFNVQDIEDPLTYSDNNVILFCKSGSCITYVKDVYGQKKITEYRTVQSLKCSKSIANSIQNHFAEFRLLLSNK